MGHGRGDFFQIELTSLASFLHRKSEDHCLITQIDQPLRGQKRSIVIRAAFRQTVSPAQPEEKMNNAGQLARSRC